MTSIPAPTPGLVRLARPMKANEVRRGPHRAPPRARCLRRRPTALAPWIIRWGPDASSDMLRRSARCTECGGKGATIQIPGWGGLQTPVRGWPGKD